MNKENIYQIIGYQGKYTESVRKALKKLLKDNHPDHGGDAYIFKMITEVKKELETDNVSYKIKTNSKIRQYDDIDYDYCHKMIIKLTKEEKNLKNSIKEMRKNLDILNNEYRKIYRKNIEKQTLLINNMKEIKKMNVLKKRIIVLIILLIISFLGILMNNNIFILLLFGLISIITIVHIYSFYQVVNSVNKKNQDKINKYVDVVSKISDIIQKKDELEKIIFNRDRELNMIQNDLRFYCNLMNK